MDNVGKNTFILLMKFFIKCFLIVHEKSMSIPDDKEDDFDDNIIFYMLCFLFDGNTIYKIIKIGSGERRRFINNIFQSPLRLSLLSKFIFF